MAHAIAAWGLLAAVFVFAVAVLVLLLALAVPKHEERKWVLQRLAIAALGYLATHGWFYVDPGRIIEWFFD